MHRRALTVFPQVDADELGRGLVELGCQPLQANQLQTIYRHFKQLGVGVDYEELAWLFFQRRSYSLLLWDSTHDPKVSQRTASPLRLSALSGQPKSYSLCFLS